MADGRRVEVEDVGADDVVGERIVGHEDDAQMTPVLGQLVPAERSRSRRWR